MDKWPDWPDNVNRNTQGAVCMSQKISSSVRRKDAEDKAAGAMEYLADRFPVSPLHGRFFYSTIARGRIKKVTFPEIPEGYHIIGADDVPGKNNIQMIKDDWPVFADSEVRYIGQILFLVVGPDKGEILRILKEIHVEYEELSPCFTLEESESLKGGVQHGTDNVFAEFHIHHGQIDGPFEKADRILEKEYYTGYQEHVYLEPQSLFGHWEDGQLVIHASAQCPFYIRHALTGALGLPDENIRVIQTPTGGAFGGKEHFPDVMAAPLGVAVMKLKQPVSLILDRKEDMAYSIKRHPSAVNIRTALDSDGNILANDIDIRLDGGAYESCSAIVLQRAVFASSNVYNFPNVRVRGRAFCTHKPPSDAFRGFGAPQAVFAVEAHMNFLAAELGQNPLEFRESYVVVQGDATVTDGLVHEQVMIPEMTERIMELSDYRNKYEAYKTEPWKGIGISFFNHGCGFTGNGERDLIKAVVYLKKDREDRVFLYGSNVEMGQGLNTTFCKIAAEVLEIPLDRVTYVEQDTGVVPDSGPTVASRSIAVVGYLFQEGARKLKDQWKKGEEQSVRQDYVSPANQVPWDQEKLTGDAYPAYSWGINVVEVEVDPLTYEIETKGLWGVYDVGVPIDRRIVEGQIHGGLIQALGYSNLEKLECRDGRFRQVTMADYAIPTSMDFPSIECDMVENPYEYGPFGAKGTGEMVFNGGAPAYAAAVSQAVDRTIDEVPVLPETLMELTDDGR